MIDPLSSSERAPDGVTLKILREKGPDYEDTAIMIGAMGENSGFMVHRGVAPFSLPVSQEHLPTCGLRA